MCIRDSQFAQRRARGEHAGRSDGRTAGERVPGNWDPSPASAGFCPVLRRGTVLAITFDGFQLMLGRLSLQRIEGLRYKARNAATGRNSLIMWK